MAIFKWSRKKSKVFLNFFFICSQELCLDFDRRKVGETWGVLSICIVYILEHTPIMGPYFAKNPLRKMCIYILKQNAWKQWWHQGGHGAFTPPHWRLCPPTCPPIRRKNGQISHFQQIFALSESHFTPLMPPSPQKNLPESGNPFLQKIIFFG